MRQTSHLAKPLMKLRKGKSSGFSLLAHLNENVQTANGTLLAADDSAAASSGGGQQNILSPRIVRLFSGKGSSTEGESYLFENNKYDIMECNNKTAWADHKTGYCHLCREPIGGSIGVHIGDRDHTNYQTSLLLSSIYPRSWKPRDVIEDIRSEIDWSPPEDESVNKENNKDDGKISNATSHQSSSAESGGEETIPFPFPPTAAHLSEREFRKRYFSNIYAFATNTKNNCEFLHVHDDFLRRSELQSLLLHLIDGGTMSRLDSLLCQWSSVPEELSGHMHHFLPKDEAPTTTPTLPYTALMDAPIPLDAALQPIPVHRAPHAVLTHSITEPNGSFPFWYSGERMWKKFMIKMISMMFPPMQAGIVTNFSQKCWGRVNEERLFDALKIQDLRRTMNLPQVPENKERKAFFMRAIFWELISAKMRPSCCPVTEVLIDVTIRRLCFELIFLQTMVYMNKIQDVTEALEYIEYNDLKRLNLW